jgi:hypothetical protein
LAALRVQSVGAEAAGVVLRTEVADGKRWGEVKTSFLSRRTDWRQRFGLESATPQSGAEITATVQS